MASGNGTRNTGAELEAGAEAALAEAIANIDAADAGSVAAVLQALNNGDSVGLLDTEISSRSSHDWDPQGRVDATISSRSSHDWDPDDVLPTSGTVATGEIGRGTTTKINISQEIAAGATEKVTLSTDSGLVPEPSKARVTESTESGASTGSLGDWYFDGVAVSNPPGGSYEFSDQLEIDVTNNDSDFARKIYIEAILVVS